MEQGLIKAVAGAENVNLTMVFILVFIILWGFERIYKITSSKKGGNPSWKGINSELAKKVNGTECQNFRTRIGTESDEHRRNITKIKDDISEIKEGVAYIKGTLK